MPQIPRVPCPPFLHLLVGLFVPPEQVSDKSIAALGRQEICVWRFPLSDRGPTGAAWGCSGRTGPRTQAWNEQRGFVPGRAEGQNPHTDLSRGSASQGACVQGLM